MYPLTRLRKLRPDGTAYISWYTYRLPDSDGYARFFVPNGTARVRSGGAWVPESVSIAAASPEDARLARSAIEEVRALITAGDPFFQRGSDMWTVPRDALSLRPRRARGV